MSVSPNIDWEPRNSGKKDQFIQFLNKNIILINLHNSVFLDKSSPRVCYYYWSLIEDFPGLDDTADVGIFIRYSIVNKDGLLGVNWSSPCLMPVESSSQTCFWSFGLPGHATSTAISGVVTARLLSLTSATAEFANCKIKFLLSVSRSVYVTRNPSNYFVLPKIRNSYRCQQIFKLPKLKFLVLPRIS